MLQHTFPLPDRAIVTATTGFQQACLYIVREFEGHVNRVYNEQTSTAMGLETSQVLASLQFGRVDAETDQRFDHCFIGTDMLRHVLQPQHSLLIGAKGSGKSAIFRLLCDDLAKLRPLLPKDVEEVFSIPVYGLQSEEYIGGTDLRELNPTTVDDFRYFWLLYLGLKAVTRLTKDPRITQLVEKKPAAKQQFDTLLKIAGELGLSHEDNPASTLKHKLGSWIKPAQTQGSSDPQEMSKLFAQSFQQRTGMSAIALLDTIDRMLREINSLAWMMLDKLDLLFIGDNARLRTAITALVQLLVEYSNRFRNIHFKVFLRTDIYHHLRIVNKSHLVSYTTEMKWRGPLLMKLLVSRAVTDPLVRSFCEEKIGEPVDVTNVIVGTDEYVQKIFYVIFDPSIGRGRKSEDPPNTHEWILSRLVDGMGYTFPREIVHLGNLAVERQREMDRNAGKHTSPYLITAEAIQDAFANVSSYRCDTYLYSEFPELSKHFDVFRGSDSPTFHRQELYMLFEPLSPKGDEAIRAVYHAGLLIPLGRNVDASQRFRVPLLYKSGLGITERRKRSRPSKAHPGLIPAQINSEVSWAVQG